MNELPRPPAKKSKTWKNAWKSYGAILAAEKRLSAAAILQLTFLCDLVGQLAEFDAAIAGQLTHRNSQGVVAHPLLQHRARCQNQILAQVRAMSLEAAAPPKRPAKTGLVTRATALPPSRPQTPITYD